MAKRAPDSRFERAPPELLELLRKYIKPLEAESDEVQMRLCWMVYRATSKDRAHDLEDGAAKFSYKTLEAWFGRGQFSEINKRVQMFVVGEQWWSDRGYTRLYWLSEAAQKAYDKFLHAKWLPITLLNMSGKVMRSTPPLLASRDSDGNNAKAKIKDADHMTLVRVDMDRLDELHKHLRRYVKDWDEGRTPSDGLFSRIPEKNALKTWADEVKKVMRASHTNQFGWGLLLHTYVEAPNGRLVAQRVNLQNTYGFIKDAALHGQWEYDFQNCHFTIIDQLAAKYKYECGAIRSYLHNRDGTRLAIADAAGITKDEAKRVLVALMYGARLALSTRNAIAKQIGIPAAKRLFEMPLFLDIAVDVARARRQIVKGWPRTANGSLTNAVGKAIKPIEDGERQSPAQLLSHLVTGIEAKALQTAINLFKDDIVLLQHDGWVATRRIDHKLVEQTVAQETGITLNLVWEQVQLDLDKLFQKYEGKQNAKRKSEFFPL